MAVNAKQLEISQALAAWLATQPQVVALGLVRCELDKSQRAHPRYPTNPVADCPLVLLTNDTGDNLRTVGGGRRSVYQMSLWYYRRQTPGEANQVKLMEGMCALEQTLLGEANPYPIEVLTSEEQTPVKVDYPDELVHPLVDEPRLRVSVGKILIQVQSETGRS